MTVEIGWGGALKRCVYHSKQHMLILNNHEYSPQHPYKISNQSMHSVPRDLMPLWTSAATMHKHRAHTYMVQSTTTCKLKQKHDKHFFKAMKPNGT